MIPYADSESQGEQVHRMLTQVHKKSEFKITHSFDQTSLSD